LNHYICIEKKLFGNVSVNDIVKASNKLAGGDSEFGVAGYTLNPKLVHGFNRNHLVPKQKLKRYLDVLQQAKAKIPGPEKYECNAHKKEFNDMNKKSKIYAHERRSSVIDAINEAKKLPGVGRYETTAFDEKRCRPPKGSYGSKDDRVLNTDVVIQASKQVPFHINDSRLVSIDRS